MAGCSSSSFSPGEVIELLDASFESDERARLAGLYDESDDEFEAIGDYTDADGTETLLSDEVLSTTGAVAILHACDNPLPSDMNSLLNLDTDLNDGKLLLLK